MEDRTGNRQEVMLKSRRSSSGRQEDMQKQAEIDLDASVKKRTEDEGERLVEFKIKDSRELTENQRENIIRNLMSLSARRSNNRRQRSTMEKEEIQASKPAEPVQRQRQVQNQDTDQKKSVLKVLSENPGIIPIYLSGLLSGVAVTLFMV